MSISVSFCIILLMPIRGRNFFHGCFESSRIQRLQKHFSSSRIQEMVNIRWQSITGNTENSSIVSHRPQFCGCCRAVLYWHLYMYINVYVYIFMHKYTYMNLYINICIGVYKNICTNTYFQKALTTKSIKMTS
jgi:hypothetical protein